MIDKKLFLKILNRKTTTNQSFDSCFYKSLFNFIVPVLSIVLTIQCW